MENDSSRRRIMNTSVPHEVIKCLLTYHPELRDLITRTCPSWREVDACAQHHIQIMSYSIKPTSLKKRLKYLQSLKIIGQPRPARFQLLPENWGGYATPWVKMVEGYDADLLTSLHFKRMIFTDVDLLIIAKRESLISLKLDWCSGFSTDGLKSICHHCTKLKNLSIEGSKPVTENDGKWLHELAINNKVLETLSFYMTHLFTGEIKIEIRDLELLAENCPKLVSMKITHCEISGLVNFFRRASSLEEFSGGIYNEDDPALYADVLPARLSRLGLDDIRNAESLVMFPYYATQLKRLDLRNAYLDTEGHCILIRKCPNLEILESLDVIGDGGLEELRHFCKKLKRLRIERLGGEPVEGETTVTQTGIMAIANGCLELEYMSVHVSDIDNKSLQKVGASLKNLCDFRLTLANNREEIPDLPLDDGVRDLLLGCVKLRRFALYLKPGWLTDVGLDYIGQHSPNVRWMLLGDVGKTDAGLLDLSNGCQSLEKLLIRGFPFFSDSAIGRAAERLQSLKYLWVQGLKGSPFGFQRLEMVNKEDWNTELIHSGQEYDNDQPIRENDQIFCYHSLVRPRADIPPGILVPHSVELLKF